jgi:N-formylglutamate amidohydrolase
VSPSVFDLYEPDPARETPVIVEIPHAGTAVPAECLATLVAPVRALGFDADLHVDALYGDACAAGATLLVARLSRYVVDLNRAPDDVDGESVEGAPLPARYAHGLFWRSTTLGERAIEHPLSRQEAERRYRTMHAPYHDTLRARIEAKRAKFGYAVVLAAHSMPSEARATPGPPRADIVPGTRGRTSAAPPFIDALDTWAQAAGYSVRHDDPYRGGYTTQTYGNPSADVHVLQLEIARRLYMNETTLERLDVRFQTLRAQCTDLAARLGRVAVTRP